MIAKKIVASGDENIGYEKPCISSKISLFEILNFSLRIDLTRWFFLFEVNILM
jgi:hypothetical protein